MTTVTLYQVGSMVTPIEQETYDSLMYRLIADEGKELIKGDVRTGCIDVEIEDAEGWEEVNTEVRSEETGNEHQQSDSERRSEARPYWRYSYGS
jgi:hypothetical protein